MERGSVQTVVRATEVGGIGSGPGSEATGSRSEATPPHRWNRCRPDCDLSPLSLRHWRGLPADLRRAAPGLLAAALATCLALGVGAAIPELNAATVAVALGVLVTNLGLARPALRRGLHVASHRLLRIAIVLLGLQLAVGQILGLGLGGLTVVLVTVAVTFVGTQLVGRALGVSGSRSLLIATGFSICGASAVAAMTEPADADADDVAVSIALVTLCGSLAIVLLPLAAGPLGLGPVDFGRWVGASVHDVGQTVATASRVPGALDSAVVVKLSRVILLAPLVAGVSLVRRRTARVVAAAAPRPPIVPVFVVGFIVAVVLRSVGILPTWFVNSAVTLQQLLLLAALFGLGTTINLGTLRRTGGRALIVGLLSWLLVAGTAYVGVRLL